MDRLPALPIDRRRRRFVLAAALACGLALAACGAAGSAAGTTGSAPSAKPQFLKFSQCMRSHGVPNFPDPGAGGGIELASGDGINPFSPAFKAAQSVCRKLLPGGGPPQGKPSAALERQMLAISDCMRAHGVTGFPDPTTTPPSSPAGYSVIEDRGGAVIAIPDTIDVASPVYVKAATACHFR
jgi:hypothetical protein